jgi:iron complex outermembrane receptor protein
MSAAVGGTAFAQAADDPGTQGGQDIVVTGSRGQARTVATSPTPIDVISGEQIAQLGGSMQLRDVLSQLVPSFQSQQVGSSSWNSVTRPAGLRGLSGVHVLVLVNGKRRHNSALIDLNSGSTSMGGNPVDLDQIPASAIARIEVLRDGAAAQYGTDAIAGVINVILKDNPNAGSGAIEAGQRYSDSVNGSDGETVSAQLSRASTLAGMARSSSPPKASCRSQRCATLTTPAASIPASTAPTIRARRPAIAAATRAACRT